MKFAVAARFNNSSEAEMACGALAAQGIEARTENGGIVDADPLLANAVGGVTVMVNEMDLDQARSILAEAPMHEPTALPVRDPLRQEMTRALFSAVIGGLILPGIANILSLWLYWRAFRRDSKAFASHRMNWISGLVFNLVMIAGVSAIAFRMIRDLGL